MDYDHGVIFLINLRKTQIFTSIINGPLFGFKGSEAKFDVRVRFTIRELGSIGFRAVWHINDEVRNRCVKHLFSPFLDFYRPQRSWDKAMFLHVSVILFTRGGLPHCMLGYIPPPTGTRGRHPPSPGPGTTPGSRQPPPPPPSACWEIRAKSGRYASYWNAILLQ